MRVLPSALLVAVVFSLSGCAPSKGEVAGKVTFKGKPVTSGTVSAIASDGIQYVGSINPDGTYLIPGVPTGDAKFSVSSPNNGAQRGGATVTPKNAASDLAPPAPAEAPAATGWFPIPDKYADPLKSGLTGNVVSPKATVDLPLD